MVRDSSSLPMWIPDAARLIYADTPLYHDPGDKRAFLIAFTPREQEVMWKDLPAAKQERAFLRLFTAPELEAVWGRFGDAISKARKSNCGPWPSLVGGLVLAAGCVPKVRATRDRPDQKTRIRDKQTVADGLVLQVAEQARALAATLRALENQRGAVVPVELDSTLDLISAALAGKGMASCRDDWEDFDGSLSSYQIDKFPNPATLLDALAAAAEEQPVDVFEGNPWLRSSHSSWRDFVRMVKEGLFPELHRNHGCLIDLREVDWINLVQVLIGCEVNHSKMNACLREINSHDQAD